MLTRIWQVRRDAGCGYAAGGDYFETKADGSYGKCTVNSEAGVKALGFMQQLALKDKVLQDGFIDMDRRDSHPRGSALRKTIGISLDFPESMKTLSWSDSRALFSSCAARLDQQSEKLGEYTHKALEEEESEFSSHPSLRTRESSLPTLKPSMKAPPGDLLNELASDEARLSEAFSPFVTEYQKRWIADHSFSAAEPSAGSETQPQEER
jgi:hypothetical protein